MTHTMCYTFAILLIVEHDLYIARWEKKRALCVSIKIDLFFEI